MKQVLETFFEHQIIMKMYHFQTKNYGAHKASDDYLAKHLANFDKFMEVWQGFAGKSHDRNFDIKVVTKSDKTIITHLDSTIGFLDQLFSTRKEELSPELANLEDEMIADLQQLKYLLTFK